MSHSIENYVTLTLHLSQNMIPPLNSLTSHYLLLTYLLMNLLDFSGVLWGGNMFWDNLNRLLGIGLHRFQWSKTQKIGPRI